MTSRYHWQCGACGSYCDADYKTDALIFGDGHRCMPAQVEHRVVRLIARPSATPQIRRASRRSA